MDILKQFNKVICYVEKNLDDEIDLNMISQISCTSYDCFRRFFSYITGMTFTEYIRKRRLTKAAYDLRSSNDRIIDIAVKYGYSGADSFSKAFTNQHGISPACARNILLPLKIYPPVSFQIIFKGAEKMDFRIVETEEFEVYGVLRRFGGTSSERFKQENIMWSTNCDFVPAQICEDFDGIWDNGNYMIARDKSDTIRENLKKYKIPAGKYAAFTTDKGGYAGDELPKLHDLIFNSWLPDSGYIPLSDLEMEIYHLQTDKSERQKNRYYEIWIPVKEK